MYSRVSASDLYFDEGCTIFLKTGPAMFFSDLRYRLQHEETQVQYQFYSLKEGSHV